MLRVLTISAPPGWLPTNSKGFAMRRAKSAQKLRTNAGAPVTSDAIQAWPLATRPGLLIRRLHQFHVALFTDGAAHLAITPVQFSLLSAISSRELVDQSTLAADVALDRSTCANTLARLEVRAGCTDGATR